FIRRRHKLRSTATTNRTENALRRRGCSSSRLVDDERIDVLGLEVPLIEHCSLLVGQQAEAMEKGRLRLDRGQPVKAARPSLPECGHTELLPPDPLPVCRRILREE